MFCPSCGKSISQNDSFCPYCGKNNKYKENSEQQTAEVSESAESVIGVETLPDDKEPVIDRIEEVSEKKKFPVKTAVITSTAILLVGVFVFLFFFTNLFKSDEALVEAKINAFISNLNSGDYEEAKNCMKKEIREKRDSGDDNINEAIQEMIGLDIGLQDAFKFAMGLTNGEILQIKEIKNINIKDDVASAKVTVKLNIKFLSDFTESTFNVKLVKEKKSAIDSDWYISEIEINKKEQNGAA